MSSDTTFSKLQAKLPKMTITVFNGSYGDWPRFWGQFSETIHKTSVPPVTKFTYLRELLCDKAKRAIEALPFTVEGYNRAISILQDRFGKESETVKTYVKKFLSSIMQLHQIQKGSMIFMRNYTIVCNHWRQ